MTVFDSKAQQNGHILTGRVRLNIYLIVKIERSQIKIHLLSSKTCFTYLHIAHMLNEYVK